MTLPPPLPPRSSRLSALAVASLILSILGLFSVILAIPAVICGHLSLSAIKRTGKMTGTLVARFGLGLGYLGVVLSVFFWGALGFSLFKELPKFEKQAALREEKGFDLSQSAIPPFPALPEFETLKGTKVRVGQIDLAKSNNPDGKPAPGTQMKMRIYLPAGEAAPASLSCVLLAPAGTNLLSGNDLDSLDEEAYHDEALPYAAAGLAVVLYSLDGSVAEGAEMEAITAAYQRFRAAGAGIVNGRNALEYVLERLPMVDPQRIFSGGHSSAGTGSLLLAAHEPRLRGCIAYAPAIDIPARMKSLGLAKDVKTILATSTLFPGYARFLELSSPSTAATGLKLPVYLFGAKDDTTVSYSDIARFAQSLQTFNPQVTLASVEEGGHYAPMIHEGIAGAIRWIQSLPPQP